MISADTGRVIAIYHGTYNMQGAAHPVNLFYTNTVDVRSLQDASLKNAADPYTLAVFALADDVVLKDADAETLKAYKDWKSSVSVEQYQECLEKARKGHRLERSFECAIDASVYDALAAELENGLAEHAKGANA